MLWPEDVIHGGGGGGGVGVRNSGGAGGDIPLLRRVVDFLEEVLVHAVRVVEGLGERFEKLVKRVWHICGRQDSRCRSSLVAVLLLLVLVLRLTSGEAWDHRLDKGQP